MKSGKKKKKKRRRRNSGGWRAHRQTAFGVTDGQVRVVVLVADVRRAATQLGGTPVLAVVVGLGAIVHHG